MGLTIVATTLYVLGGCLCLLLLYASERAAGRRELDLTMGLFCAALWPLVAIALVAAWCFEMFLSWRSSRS